LNDPTPVLQKFLALLQPYADQAHPQDENDGNYEDFYFLADQIADDYQTWSVNPAIHPFLDRMKTQAKGIADRLHTSIGGVADHTRNFIRSGVHQLVAKITAVRGLDLIEALAHAESIERLDLVTLNHDLLVERLFEAKRIAVEDGFGEPVQGVRYFEPSRFESDARIRLFKLHGSINWYRFRGEKGNAFSDRYGIPVRGDPAHCQGADGAFLDNVDVIPWILAGTSNKATQYGFGIYAEMHFWFHKLLHEHDTVVMSGYGWNDRGINGRFMDWLHQARQNRLFLLHANPDEIAQKSRSAMWHRYEPLVEAGRLVAVPKWMQDVSLDDLMTTIQTAKR
jgi:hypothetical protein